MPNIRDIASQANVSIATVSRVLNDAEGVGADLRDRVKQVAGRLGYAAVKKPAGQFLALAYTGRSSVNSPYDTAILQALSDVADREGFDLAIVKLQAARVGDETLAQTLQRKGVSGVIVRTHTESRQLCLELAGTGFPHVVVGERFDEPFVNFVSADSGPTTQQAVEHLISLGHRRIAIALSHVLDTDHADRLAGYTRALEAHGIPLDEKLIYRVWAKQPHGEQVVRNLMGLADRPTALFIADPFIAVGAVNKAHQMGVRIPEDVSIIGFDDAEMRQAVYPPLSAVCQDAYRIGHEAAEALAQFLRGRREQPIRLVLPTLLELHRTTGPAPLERVRILPDRTRIADAMNAAKNDAATNDAAKNDAANATTSTSVEVASLADV